MHSGGLPIWRQAELEDYIMLTNIRGIFKASRIYWVSFSPKKGGGGHFGDGTFLRGSQRDITYLRVGPHVATNPTGEIEG